MKTTPYSSTATLGKLCFFIHKILQFQRSYFLILALVPHLVFRAHPIPTNYDVFPAGFIAQEGKLPPFRRKHLTLLTSVRLWWICFLID